MIRKAIGEEMEKLAYEESYELVKEEIQKALTNSPRIINEYLTHLSAAQGKMIRAVSVLTCAQDEEGKINPSAVHAAAAIEIIHLASLVHDDVIDDADLRRGKETLQKKYGKRTAVNIFIIFVVLPVESCAENDCCDSQPEGLRRL